MPHILLIETSTKACSVAVTDHNKVLANELLLPNNFVHAEKLNLLIINILNTACIDFNQLNAVAFSSGPGSYTGLRIGLSTAKALCYTLNIPLIYVDTLKIMALKAKSILLEDTKEFLLCPMIDARRMEVYTAIYNRELNIIENTSAKIIDPGLFRENKRDTIYFFGDGAPKCRKLIETNNLKYLPEISPDAFYMAEDAYYKFINGIMEDVAYCEPFYLKEFNNAKQ